MQEIQGNMDDVLSRNDLQADEQAKRCFQLQNRYLAFTEKLNTRTRPEEIISGVPDLTSSTQDILRQQRQHSPLPSTPST